MAGFWHRRRSSIIRVRASPFLTTNEPTAQPTTPKPSNPKLLKRSQSSDQLAAMGLFGTSTTKSTEPETKIAPNRSQRAKCWEARDAFFECLDRNSIIDSVKEDKKAKEVCGGENVKFEKECVASWVRTFLALGNWTGDVPTKLQRSCLWSIGAGTERAGAGQTRVTRASIANGLFGNRSNTSRSEELWNTTAIR